MEVPIYVRVIMGGIGGAVVGAAVISTVIWIKGALSERKFMKNYWAAVASALEWVDNEYPELDPYIDSAKISVEEREGDFYVFLVIKDTVKEESHLVDLLVDPKISKVTLRHRSNLPASALDAALST